MTKVEAIEREIKALSPQDLAAFRQWFGEFDAAAWERQIEEDAKAGKLDVLAESAVKALR